MKTHSLARTLLLGMATPKGSQLMDPLNKAVLKLSEDGVLEDLRVKRYGEVCAKEECNNISLFGYKSP